ncbi:MAG: serine/threonine-protein kinase [Anaerolineales bacterium]|nr:serine/threonine-protein kinase [Anaerolineales bacterium]
MPNLVGQTLAKRYRVLSAVGKGGMAGVYKVRDVDRNADLAIKVLNPELAANRAFVEHFRDEATTLKKLDHPNIVRFYNLERDDDILFIVMDYVDGVTLREEMRARDNKPLARDRILKIMRGICAALNYAHKSGYVHRDIKPTNILISRDDKVFVTDFGIARFSGNSSDLGQVGTPGYMPPEQIRGEPSIPASDIYSLGVLLYEMTTGTRPFNGQSANTAGTPSERVRQEHLHSLPPSPRAYNSAISPQLERIILFCLEKDPSRRFRSAMDLLNALEHADFYSDNKLRVDPAATNDAVENIVRVKKKNLAFWLVSLGFMLVVISILVIGGGRLSAPKPDFNNATPIAQIPPAAPTATFAPRLSFSVRPYNTYADTNIKSLWSFVSNLNFPEMPGHYYWQADIPANTTVLLNLGWCASDASTLNANLRYMIYSAAIDGVKIDESNFNVFNASQNGMSCQERAGVLSGLPPGRYAYVETMRVIQDIFDGNTNYPAGDYIYELTVNVK